MVYRSDDGISKAVSHVEECIEERKQPVADVKDLSRIGGKLRSEHTWVMVLKVKRER